MKIVYYREKSAFKNFRGNCLTILEFPYYIGYTLKKRHALKGQKRLPFPVISIGNITVGGTGKTPAAIALAEEALRRGLLPIVLTRGYRGKANGPCFVRARKYGGAEGPSFCSSARDAGDEPMLMAERLKNVPIVKCADRYEGGLFALQHLADLPTHRFTASPILFILDDGFQHWKLHRDVDIVLIDGLNPFGNRRLLPLGPLREPLSALKRADVFVVTKTENEKAVSTLRAIKPGAPAYASRYHVLGIRDSAGEAVPIERLKDRAGYVFCGIANDASFRQTVQFLGVEIKGYRAYRDHHNYSEADLSFLIKEGRRCGSEIMVTTEKDMVKLRDLGVPENLFSVEIAFQVDPGFFDTVFSKITQGRS